MTAIQSSGEIQGWTMKAVCANAPLNKNGSSGECLDVLVINERHKQSSRGPRLMSLEGKG